MVCWTGARRVEVQTTTPVVGRRVGRRVGACESNESESRRKSVLNSGRPTIRPQFSTPRSKTICMYVCRKQGQKTKCRVYLCTVLQPNSSAHSSAQSTGFSPISGGDGDPSPEGPRRLRHQGRQVACVGRLPTWPSASLSVCADKQTFCDE